MGTAKVTSKEYFRTLSIVHMALFIGPVVFGLMVSLLVFKDLNPNKQDELYPVLLYVVSAFYAIGLIANPFIFRNKLASIKTNKNLSYKISTYRSALIVRYALIEGLTFFAVVAAFISNNLIFMAYAGFTLLIMAYRKPTREMLIGDLELDRDEIDSINNPDAIITEQNTARGY